MEGWVYIAIYSKQKEKYIKRKIKVYFEGFAGRSGKVIGRFSSFQTQDPWVPFTGLAEPNQFPFVKNLTTL